MLPLPAEHQLDNHLQRLDHEGYTLVPGAIPPDELRRVVAKFDEIMPRLGVVPTAALPDTPSRDVNRLFEVDPIFEPFIAHPSVFPIIEAVMGGDVTLLGSGIANYVPPRSPARVPWHRDGNVPYVRATFYLTDVSEETGPTAVMPGSHRTEASPPAWFNENQQPREIPGMKLVTVPAGTCLINHTRIWHTSTPNVSDLPRKLIWVVYKFGRDELTPFVELRTTDAFAQRQVDPLRRKLCGLAPLP